MLIYVDKKKEKRRKIKKICLISSIIIFFCLNILYYNRELNHEQNNLSSYQTITYQNPWYDNARPIHLFSSNENPSTNIIFTPQIDSKETAITLAFTFKQLPKGNYTLIITDEVSEKDFIKQIFETATEHSPDAPFSEIIITGDFNSIREKINNLKLYPKTFSYSKALNQQLSLELNDLLNNHYPLPQSPENKIEKEQQALAEFVEENKQELIDLILQNKSPKFSKQSTFLKAVRLCLENDITVSCQMQPDTSLILNLQNSLKNFPKNSKPQKLLLLSTNQQIQPEETSQIINDEGLYFRYKQIETFLLPQELNSLTIKKEPLAILKEKAGFNPEYTSPEMELYKFKITEVNLDEEI